MADKNSRYDDDVYASPLHAVYITRQEAADLLRVSPITVDTYYYRGLINKYKIDTGNGVDTRGGRTLYKREEILGLVKPCPAIPPGNYTTRRRFQGHHDDPAVVEARTVDEVQREALKRYDQERGQR